MGRKTTSKRGKPHRAQGPGAAAGPVARKATPVDRIDWTLRGLTVLGVLLTAYLAWIGMRGTGAAFCTEGSGCGTVQGSQWSYFLGLPIAAWGLLLYVVLAWTAWRGGARQKRWKRMWRLAFWGLAISVYLTLAGWIALQALCLWCLASLAIMAAVFVLVHLHRPDGAPGTAWPTWWLGNGLVAAGLLLALQASAMGLLERREDPRLRDLAVHLAESGAKFYGASWCPNCTTQKRAFGAAAKRLPYVECSPNGRNGGVAFECTSAGIGGYPTWVIGGRQYVEAIDPERLAGLTGYDWERDRRE